MTKVQSMDENEKHYRVVISQHANGRMWKHFYFLARVSEKAAEQMLNTMLKDIRSLETLPMRNPFYESSYLPENKYRYLLSAQRYRIVYFIEKAESTVYVEDIEDCRQSY